MKNFVMGVLASIIAAVIFGFINQEKSTIPKKERIVAPRFLTLHMKFKVLLLGCVSFMIVLVSCNSVERPLSLEEKEKIKATVIADIEKHVSDIISQDYNKVMQFYVKEDYILFGDGAYWGDYKTVDEIWGTWLPRWKKITKWELKNHKVHVISRDAATDYVEWVHERIEEDGDTTRAHGFWVWGMQRFPEGWRSVNAAIDHRYTAGPNAKKNN